MPPAGYIQSELDLKLLVLYIMARTAEPVTIMHLWEVALCDEGVDYFSLTEAVAHMVETGQLSKEKDRFIITEKGRRNSEICESSLPYSVRRHCDESLSNINRLLRQEAQIQTDISDNPDGTCTLHLCLNDIETPLLKLELLAPSQDQAQAMAKKFRTDPARLYLHITRLLTQKEETYEKK